MVIMTKVPVLRTWLPSPKVTPQVLFVKLEREGAFPPLVTVFVCLRTGHIHTGFSCMAYRRPP